MRIAYFIMLHHKAYQFEWLLNAVYDENDIYFVHVDIKSLFNWRGRGGTYGKVRALIRDKPNVILMTPRYTNWGGWSLSRIILRAIDLALDRDKQWGYFVNLSGECYPLMPLAALRSELAKTPDRLYVQTTQFSTLPASSWHPKRPRVFETPAKIVILPGSRQPPKTFSIDAKGSQWVILSRAFCEWQRTAPLRREISRYLRFSPLSDELIFQTLMLNGPFRDRQAPHYGRAIKLTEVDAHAGVLGMADLPFLDSVPAFFGRKFDAKVDVAVLNHLAARVGAKLPLGTDYGDGAVASASAVR